MKNDKKINPGDVVALGDIHGMWEMYEQFLQDVEGTGAVVVILGDMIDRGGGDLEVLSATLDRLQDPEAFGLGAFYALRGNHEEMFLNAGSGDNSAWAIWVQNGGNWEDYTDMLKGHAEWIKQLPHYMTIGDTLFVHAGISPGKDPAWLIQERKADYLLWIRQPFLAYGPEFQDWNPDLKLVVHGHTPCDEPTVENDRINIDTGACFKDGYLTAYNVTQGNFLHYHAK